MSTILLVDDEEFIRSLVERILLKNEHKVLLAENGTEGVNLYQSHKSEISLAIIDMTMDDINGFEVLEQIRKLSPNFPGIISSGDNFDDSDVPVALKSNIFFLQKPYRASQLIELVNSILIPA